jgi:CRISPR type IV-associated protein Csf2
MNINMKNEIEELTISGYIKTLGPLHISATDDNLRYDPQYTRVTIGSNRIGFPCTATRYEEWRLSALEQQTANVPTIKPGILRVPVIPATTMRGRLRRYAADIVLEELSQRDDRVGFKTYQVLRSGAATGRPASGSPSLPAARAQQADLHLGLFGGGPYMLAGRLSVSTAYPMLRYLHELGLFGDRVAVDDLIETGAVRSLLGYAQTVRGNDALQYRDPNAAATIANYDDEMLRSLGNEAASRAAALKNADKSKSKKAQPVPEAVEDPAEEVETERSLRTLAFIEYVVGGTPFYWSLNARRVTHAQAGLLMTAVQRLFTDSRGIGGKSAAGYGRITASGFTIASSENDETELFDGINLALNSGESAFIADCIEAKDAALAGLSASVIDRLTDVA